MNFQMNQKTIIALAILVVVCCGSILGVKMMTDAIEPQTTLPTVSQTLPTVPPTTAPTTTAPTTTEPTTTAPTTTEPTTTAPPLTLPTTAPTTMPTTLPTLPSTTAPTTLPSLQIPSMKPSDGNPQTNIENAALFDKGFLSYQFDPDGNFYYTNEDPWQRALGYNELYDNMAAFTAIYIDTMRCKFRYDNKDWMIQFWKGQYGYVFIGHEIGVYYKPIDRTTEHYDCVSDEDSLYMSMNGLRKGEIIYSRDYGRYWWCTGFVPGKLDKFSDRSELAIDCRITMKDKEMLGAFVGSLDSNGLIRGEDYKVKGLDVYIVW